MIHILLDLVCNQTMGGIADISWRHPKAALLFPRRYNVLAYSGGGCRYEGLSALGWALSATDTKRGK